MGDFREQQEHSSKRRSVSAEGVGQLPPSEEGTDVGKGVPKRSFSADHDIQTTKKNGAVKLELRMSDKEDERQAKEERHDNSSSCSSSHGGVGDIGKTMITNVYSLYPSNDNNIRKMNSSRSLRQKFANSSTSMGSSKWLNNNSSSNDKISLDELMESNHNNWVHRSSHHRRHNPPRQLSNRKLTARGTQQLQKSLSVTVMQDLSNSFHTSDLLNIKQGLYGIHHQTRKKEEEDDDEEEEELLPPSPATKHIIPGASTATNFVSGESLHSASTVQDTAEKLAEVFVKALFPQQQKSQPAANPYGKEAMQADRSGIQQQVRSVIREMTLDNMLGVVQHIETCQSTNTVIPWNDLQKIVDPLCKLDWDQVLLHSLHSRIGLMSMHSKSSSAAKNSSNNNESSYLVLGESSCWESYETLVEYYESSSSCSSSYLMSDDGAEAKNHSDDESSTENSGFSIDAYTEHCNSSITLEDCWSVGDDDDISFAEDEEDGGQTVIEIEASEMEEVEEEEIEEEEAEEEVIDEVNSDCKEIEMEEVTEDTEVIIEIDDEEEERVAETEKIEKIEETVCKGENAKAVPAQCDDNHRDSILSGSMRFIRTEKKVEYPMLSQPSHSEESSNVTFSPSFLERRKKVAALIALFEKGCKS